MALGCTSHFLNSQRLTNQLQYIFDEHYRLEDGRAAGSDIKLAALKSGHINEAESATCGAIRGYPRDRICPVSKTTCQWSGTAGYRSLPKLSLINKLYK